MTYKAWIIYNGFLKGDSFYDFAKMIHEAATAANHEATIYSNQSIISILNRKISILPHERPDYVVCTDKDTYLARQLELLGIPVFNSAEAIAISDDKIMTYQSLAHAEVPIPKTIFAPKTFGVNVPFDDDYVTEVIQNLSFPMVMKEAFGSFGEQVYLVKNERQLTEKISDINGRPFLFQQFIEASYGRDIRLQVVGNQVVAAMKRTSQSDFRANVTAGGTMTVYTPTAEEIAVAVTASQQIGADFSGVDLLFGPNGPVVCEVNSNAHIRNILNCTGVNAAYHIVHYIEKKLGDTQ